VTANDIRQPPVSEEGNNGPGRPDAGSGTAPSGRSRRSRKQRAPLSPAGAAVVATTGTLAALGLWFVFYALVLSGLQENHTQHLMYSLLRNELAAETVPIGGPIAPGTPIAEIDAVSIGLHAVVVEGTSSADLAKGPGHLPDTPLPGQAGNCEIYGRSVTFGGPFGGVHDLRSGAIITVTTGQGVFDFRVLDVRGPHDPLPSAAAVGQSSLTLVTTAASGWRSGWAPDHVIYADATLAKGAVQSAPSGRPGAVPAVDKLLSGDNGALVPLVLWLQALVLVGGGLAFAYTRWTVWQLWVVGLPAVVAVLWIASNFTLLLLPNLV
jgi:sortase A